MKAIKRRVGRPAPFIGQEPTEAQRRVLDYVRGYVRENGIAPSQTEIQEAMRYGSRNAAVSLLRGLAARGWIQLTRDAHRSLRLVSPAPRVRKTAPTEARR